MANKKKQSRLESEAIDKRLELELISDYQKQYNEYNAFHNDAIADGDIKGKGNGETMGYAVPGETTSRAISRKNFNTSHAGGKYDIEGYNEVGGREFLSQINLYNEENSYSADSVDTTANVEAGQFVIS